MLDRMWDKGALVPCLWECKLVHSLWKTVYSFLKKLKRELPYDPAIPLLGIQTKKMKTLNQKDTCSAMFTIVLFTIAKMIHAFQCS